MIILISTTRDTFIVVRNTASFIFFSRLRHTYYVNEPLIHLLNEIYLQSSLNIYAFLCELAFPSSIHFQILIYELWAIIVYDLLWFFVSPWDGTWMKYFSFAVLPCFRWWLKFSCCPATPININFISFFITMLMNYLLVSKTFRLFTRTFGFSGKVECFFGKVTLLVISVVGVERYDENGRHSFLNCYFCNVWRVDENFSI